MTDKQTQTTLDDLLDEYIQLYSKVERAVMFAETMDRNKMANAFDKYADKLRDRRIAVYQEIEKHL